MRNLWENHRACDIFHDSLPDGRGATVTHMTSANLVGPNSPSVPCSHSHFGAHDGPMF